MEFNVIYLKEANKFIKKNKEYGARFVEAFKNIAQKRENFEKPQYDIKFIVGSDGEYRLRIGKYRAIFKTIYNELVIIVFDIDNRGEIYKKRKR